MSPASQSRAMPSSIRTPREPATPAFDNDGASDDSALDSSPPLSPDDAELLAKLEEEAMMDMDVDAEAIEAHARAEARRVRSRRERIFDALFAAPTDLVRRVYANPDSLLVFPPDSAFRRACDTVRSRPWFETFILACVILNGVLLATQRPEAQIDQGAKRRVPESFGDAAQATFVIVFTVEAFVKIVASGFLFAPDAYLRQYWNMLDFTVVVAGLVELVSSAAGAQLMPLRLVRTLQPLRALNKFKSGRMVLQTLGSALPMLVDVVLFMLWFVVSMTVMGTMFFGGTMTTRAYAPRSDAEVVEVEAATAAVAAGASARVVGEAACEVLTEAWLETDASGATRNATGVGLIAGYNVPLDSDVCRHARLHLVASQATNVTLADGTANYAGEVSEYCCDSDLAPFDDYVRFDHFGQAVFVVLQVMTIDGWNEVTWPICDANGWLKPMIYTAVVVVIGGFVVIQLFTSVICAAVGENVNDETIVDEERDVAVAVAAVSATVRETTRLDDETRKSIDDAEKAYVRSEFALIFREIVENEKFDAFIMACICGNSLLMMSNHHEPAEWYVDASHVLELAFTIVFIVEFAFKHLGLGLRAYWSEPWNRLDGFIVLVSIGEFIMLAVASGGMGVNLSFLRVFRIFRIVRGFKMLRENREFVRILESAIVGLKAMWVFLLVWALLLLIFAILGVQLFGGRGELDSDRLGFRDVGSALLTLFVVSTGENTFEVAYATIQATGSNWAGLYMVVWLIITTAILSLILGILIDAITAENDELEAEETAEKGPPGDDSGWKEDRKEDPDAGHFKTHQATSGEPPDARDAKRLESARRRRIAIRAKADVAVVRRWLVAIGEEKHDAASMAVEKDLTPGEKLAARRRLDAFSQFPRRGARMNGIGSVRKLNAVMLDELALDEAEEKARALRDAAAAEKVASMRAEIAERVARRRMENEERRVALHPEDVTPETITWERMRPIRWKRAAETIEFTDEDGQPKSEARLEREEQEYAQEQEARRANQKVILGVLGIHPPRQEEDDKMVSLARSGANGAISEESASETNSPRGILRKKNDAFGDRTSESVSESNTPRSPRNQKSDAFAPNWVEEVERRRRNREDARGWAGGDGFLGLEGGHLRLLVLRVVTHPLFEVLILLAIGVSSCMLAAETHTFPREGTETFEAFFIVDVLFTMLFTAEMAAKVYAFGLYGNSGAYLKSSFNILDVLVVFSSLFTLVLGGGGALKSLRLLRALRPLRSIHKLPSLKLVINAVIASLPAITHVCLLGVGLGTVLSIMGMELFRGKMWYCAWLPEGTTIALGAEDNETPSFGKERCVELGGTWRNNKFNFDNFAEAMLSVFIISTGDNWQDIMYVAMDAGSEPGDAPERDHSGWAASYFVLVVLVAMLFWANLFVSALVDNFNRMAAKGGPTLVSDEQRRWQNAMQLATISHTERWRLHPPKRAGYVRRRVHAFCRRPAFDALVISVIFLNLLVMVAYRHDASDAERDAQLVFDYVFTCFYILEAGLLIAAMSWKTYWRNPMNRVDFFVAIAGFLDLAVPTLSESGMGDAFRVARFLRLVKLIKISRGLRTLALTFVQSLPAVANISLLSALIVFIYSCLGVSLYGDTIPPFSETIALSEYSNFCDFRSAYVALFVTYTGNWMSFFSEMYRDVRCDAVEAPSEAVNCSRDVTTVFFFFTFVIVAIFLLANLFVAVILDQFSACADKEGVLNGGSGVVDLVITTVQLRKIAKLIKSKITRKRALAGAFGYTSARGGPGPGGADNKALESIKRAVGGVANDTPGAPSTPMTPHIDVEEIKTAIAEAANVANQNASLGRGPTKPLDAAAEAVLSLFVQRTGGTPTPTASTRGTVEAMSRGALARETPPETVREAPPPRERPSRFTQRAEAEAETARREAERARTEAERDEKEKRAASKENGRSTRRSEGDADDSDGSDPGRRSLPRTPRGSRPGSVSNGYLSADSRAAPSTAGDGDSDSDSGGEWDDARSSASVATTRSAAAFHAGVDRSRLKAAFGPGRAAPARTPRGGISRRSPAGSGASTPDRGASRRAEEASEESDDASAPYATRPTASKRRYARGDGSGGSGASTPDSSGRREEHRRRRAHRRRAAKRGEDAYAVDDEAAEMEKIVDAAL